MDLVTIIITTGLCLIKSISLCQVAAEIPSQPPPVSEYGVVGSDPAAVQFISLCLEYLHTQPDTTSKLLEVWRQNLNEFTMKSAVEVSSHDRQQMTSPFLKTKLRINRTECWWNSVNF